MYRKGVFGALHKRVFELVEVLSRLEGKPPQSKKRFVEGTGDLSFISFRTR